MPARRLTTIVLSLMLIPLAAVVAVLVIGMFAGGSAGGTLSTGRMVMAHSDSMFLSASFSTDTATIQTAGKTIVVRPTSLLVDGTKVANIDKAVAAVEVRMKGGEIAFIVDGKAVPASFR